MDPKILCKEAVLATFATFSFYQGQTKAAGYLIAIANNIVRNQLRRKNFTGQFNEKVFQRTGNANHEPGNCNGHSSPASCVKSAAGKR